ncbi:MAG: hypothetical protein JO333_14215 [Verrucomicrobia bacterium]|nr:hypothetical protein [Verrucomicrobiota bacterium]
MPLYIFRLAAKALPNSKAGTTGVTGFFGCQAGSRSDAHLFGMDADSRSRLTLAK